MTYSRTRDERVSTAITDKLFDQLPAPTADGITRWSGSWEELHYLVANALEEAKAELSALGVPK